MKCFFDLVTNPYLVTAISSWLVSQILKTIIHVIVNKKFDFKRLLGDGGMPSAHSATVTSLAIAAALRYGVGTFEFALSAVFAIVICRDAMGVRHETGKQAVVLNELVKTVEADTETDLPDVHLKELVGHTPLQVMTGVLVGVLNACFMHYVVF